MNEALYDHQIEKGPLGTEGAHYCNLETMGSIPLSIKEKEQKNKKQNPSGLG